MYYLRERERERERERREKRERERERERLTDFYFIAKSYSVIDAIDFFLLSASHEN